MRSIEVNAMDDPIRNDRPFRDLVRRAGWIRPAYAGLAYGPVREEIATPRHLDRRLRAPDEWNRVEGRVCRAPQPPFLPNSGAERRERDRGAEKRNRAPESS